MCFHFLYTQLLSETFLIIGRSRLGTNPSSGNQDAPCTQIDRQTWQRQVTFHNSANMPNNINMVKNTTQWMKLHLLHFVCLANDKCRPRCGCWRRHKVFYFFIWVVDLATIVKRNYRTLGRQHLHSRLPQPRKLFTSYKKSMPQGSQLRWWLKNRWWNCVAKDIDIWRIV